jgi:hypothetical protein
MHSDMSQPTPANDARGALNPLRELLRERATSFVATLVLLQGTAEVIEPATKRSRPVEAGVRISAATRLRVLSGRALVRLDDGSDVWLASGAEIDFSSWSERARRIGLLAGKALALVARETRRAFEINAPAGTILVTGTAFEADTTGGVLSVAVLHGSVELATDRGRVRARKGDVAEARPASSPTVRALTRRVADWAGDLAPSATNSRVSPAYRATAKSLNLRAESRAKEKPDMAQNKKTGIVVGLAALVLLAGVGVAIYATQNDAPAASGTPQAQMSFTPGPGGGDAHRQVVSERKIAIKTDDGRVIEINPEDPASIEAALAQIPAEKRDELREKLENLPKLNLPGGGEWSSSGPGDGPLHGDGDALNREAKASADAMKALIDQGMSPEDASRIVSQALTDSLQKQIGDGNTKVKAFISDGSSVPGNANILGPDGKPMALPPGATVLMVGVENESGGDKSATLDVNVSGQPPAPPAPKK